MKTSKSALMDVIAAEGVEGVLEALAEFLDKEVELAEISEEDMEEDRNGASWACELGAVSSELLKLRRRLLAAPALLSK